MNAATKEMIAGLRQAIQAERTGYEFYKMAAQRTRDPAGKRTFDALAEEEAHHHHYLITQYRALVETGTWAKGLSLKGKKHRSAKAPIFSSQLRKRIRKAHFEMSALAIAAQLELNGINHYRKLSSVATTPEAKRFFNDLVLWESAHYDAFIRQQQSLQEEYWDQARFAPF